MNGGYEKEYVPYDSPRAAISGHFDRRGTVSRYRRRADRAFVPGGVKLCGRLAACDFILYKRKTGSDHRMVSGFGLAGGGRRKVGEMGTDDLGKRNPAGGGRSDRKAAAELEKKCFRRNLSAVFLCLFGGLSLGREGPSIQLGAMTGQGISRILDRGKTEERYLMTCGASAGLAAAFHAPLAGVMFAIEEIHKGFSVSILISVMTASVTADFISSYIIGLDPVFAFRLDEFLPQRYYGLLLLLGVIVGVAGVFYNWAMLKVQELYKKPKCLDETGRLLIAFLTAGVLGLCMPEVLGSGHELIVSLTDGEMVLKTVLLVLVVKFVFSAVSFGSGAPGGIFFPLLILGAMIGGAFAMIGTQWFGLPQQYINNFVLLAMAGFFYGDRESSAHRDRAFI